VRIAALCSAAFVTACGTPSLANAGSIPIANHGFEAPVLAPGELSTLVQDWSESANSISTWRPQADSFDLSTIDGHQIVEIVFRNGASIAQQLTTEMVLGQEYRLSALLGEPYTRRREGGSLELWAGGTVAAGKVDGGTMLGSLTIADDQLRPGRFVRFATQIVAPSSGSLAGELLSVRFAANVNTGLAYLDNVQLETVPEPASAALAWTGLLFLDMRLRRAVRVRHSSMTSVHRPGIT
jgi:hypothetical protein